MGKKDAAGGEAAESTAWARQPLSCLGSSSAEGWADGQELQ